MPKPFIKTDFNRAVKQAKKYANKMCRLRQEVIDKAKAWKNDSIDDETYYSAGYKLSEAIKALEKYEKSRSGQQPHKV